jgi:hypothetical protein
MGRTLPPKTLDLTDHIRAYGGFHLSLFVPIVKEIQKSLFPLFNGGSHYYAITLNPGTR